MGSGRVAKSTDGGLTFSNVGTGLPDVPVSRLVVGPADKNTATSLGVYRTTNGGASWNGFGTGLPFVEVADIYIASDASFLLIASFGRGVWESIRNVNSLVFYDDTVLLESVSFLSVALTYSSRAVPRLL